MSPLGIGLVATFAAFAIDNWAAVARPRPDGRQVAISKVGATCTLVAIAALAGDMAVGARAALVVAVVFCLAGDVALLGETERHFLAGLGAFALGHVAYIVCALLIGVEWPRLAWSFPFLTAVAVVQIRTRMIPRTASRDGATMGVAVAIYSLIISAMVVAATGTPFWSAGVGAMVFAVSDSLIGHDRFVRPLRHARIAVMATYHVGQVLLVGGLIAGG